METRTNTKITIKEKLITVKRSTGIVYRKETQSSCYITKEEIIKKPLQETGGKKLKRK